MAGGRGQAEIRKSNPPIDTNEVLSLTPKKFTNVIKKERAGLDG